MSISKKETAGVEKIAPETQEKEKTLERKEITVERNQVSLEKEKKDKIEKTVEIPENRKMRSVEQRTPFEFEVTDYERLYTESFRKFSKIEYKNYLEGSSRYQEEIDNLKSELAIQRMTNKIFLALLWRILKTLK